MKDEIKEINITFPGQILDYVDTKEHLLELFNHITNLQEEIERQSKAQVILDNQIADMQQNLWEEQELSELFKDKYEKMKENAEILSKGYSDLEKRNEKAIKLIKDKYYKEEYERKGTFTNKLMNILQGEDKDE